MYPVYEWSYPTLSVVPQLGEYSDVVVMARWALVGRENGVVTSRQVRPVALPLDSTQAFVSFHTLTREQVDSWLPAAGAPQLDANGNFTPIKQTEAEILQPYLAAGLDILNVVPPWEEPV